MRKKSLLLILSILICIAYVLHFKQNEEEIYNRQFEVDENIVNSIINQYITADMSDYEKVKTIHNYITSTTIYDSKNLENNSIPDIDYTAKGVLEYHTAVCRGYAEAFKLLMNRLNIECEIITGYSNNISHAWNIVKIDEEWYEIDCTYDDPVNLEGSPNNTAKYNYFLVTTEQMNIDHTPDSDHPVCTSEKYMYQEKESGIPYCILDSIIKLPSSVSYSYGRGSKKVTFYFPEYVDNFDYYVMEISNLLATSSAKQFSYTPVEKCGKYYYTTITVSETSK